MYAVQHSGLGIWPNAAEIDKATLRHHNITITSPVHNHLIFMPCGQERSTATSAQWRQGIQEVDSNILAYLRDSVAGGFDEAQYGDRIGFASLKRCHLPSRHLTLIWVLWHVVPARLSSKCSFVAAAMPDASSQLKHQHL